jgi:3-dehydroquinate synthase
MAKPNQPLVIQCASHEYPIYIGTNLLADAALLRRHVNAAQVLIVSNETIAPLYLARVKQALSSMQCDEVVLPDGEMYKNQHSLTTIYDVLIKNNHHRDTTLIALGGGVIGDLTGFAAATYQRGVRFIQLPTTLLAQVDASIGGKTAINHPNGKNMIGSFHPPHAVFIDLTTLTTLPLREFNAGLAEVIKYGLLVGGDFLNTLRVLLAEQTITASTPQLADIIERCCRIKAEIVQEDEREIGQRVVLNLGHTVAHALEAYTHYQRWLHGEAVGIGLYCAALLSYQLGYLNKESLVLIDEILLAAKLPRRIPKGINLLELQALMLNDKKIKNKTLRFVLMRALGDCYLDSEVTADCLHHVLTSAVEGD